MDADGRRKIKPQYADGPRDRRDGNSAEHVDEIVLVFSGDAIPLDGRSGFSAAGTGHRGLVAW